MILKRKGPFDSVVAFSQGAVIAAVVASLLGVKVRRKAYEDAYRISTEVLPDPQSFIGIEHPPLKFAVLCAGRVGSGSFSEWVYQPRISTPFCHVIGVLDTAVTYQKHRAELETLASNPSSQVIVHAGAQFVPSDKHSICAIASFIVIVHSPA